MRKVIFPKKVETIQLKSLPSTISSQVSLISKQVVVFSKRFLNSSSSPVKLFIYTSASLSIIPIVIFAFWVSLTLLGSVVSAGRFF